MSASPGRRQVLARALAEGATPALAEAVAPLLRQVTHDLQSPLSSLSLEAFSLQDVARRIARLLGTAASEAVRAELAEIEDIGANLATAQAHAAGIVDELGELARELERRA